MQKTTTKALQTMFEPGDVFEIRVLGAERPGDRYPHIESGYFDYDHISEAADAIAALGNYDGVYTTLNPVDPCLLARANNRLRRAKSGEATSDKDVVCRRWMLVDIDVERPAGICATSDEKQRAIEKASEIKTGLESIGWPAPVVVDSGNGVQLLYRIDAPSNDGGLVQRCLQALAPCSNSLVHIDQSVHNAARICRLPGTWNRKGENLEARPHRVSEVLEVPKPVTVVAAEQLEALANKATVKQPERIVCNTANAVADDYNNRGDIGSLLEQYGWQLIGTTAENEQWRRPGKTAGNLSATYNGETFFVFSSSAYPFEANRGYSRFGVYATLRHNGDFASATESLRCDGYGREQLAYVDLSSFMQSYDESPAREEVEPPADMFEVPGFVADVMKYTLGSAPYPNTALAFAGALAMQAHLLGRKVQDDNGIRPNLYVVALADSGSGKEYPRQVNTNLAYHVGMCESVADTFASGEGIEDCMFQNHSMLFQVDEIDGLLNSINKAKDARNEMIMNILLKMYSSANNIYTLRKKAGQQDVLTIMQPSLTLYGTAVPQYYYESLSKRMLNNGFFARLLIIEAEGRGEGQESGIVELPVELIEQAAYWCDFSPSKRRINNLAKLNPSPEIIATTDAAKNSYSEIRQIADAEYAKAQRDGDVAAMATWARAYEKTRKLALIYACSEDYRKPKITEVAIDWAWRFTQYQTYKMLAAIEENVSENEFESQQKRVIQIIKSAGNAIPKNLLTRRTQFLNRRQRQDVLDNLIEGGLLREQFEQTSGHPKTYYCLT